MTSDRKADAPSASEAPPIERAISNVSGTSRWFAEDERTFFIGKGDDVIGTINSAEEARLWVFAPDMLAVLKRVEASLTVLGATGNLLNSTRSVIAKAEGRE
jgi:hypothetical protein